MKRSPIAPAVYTVAIAEAVKAVAAGNATPGQQTMCMNWIIHHAAGTYDETFVPGQPDTSDHLSGRRNVGLQLVKLINVPISDLKPDPPKG
jgi:hypothetical protein